MTDSPPPAEAGASPPAPGPPPDGRTALREALGAFAVATVLCAAFFWIGQGVPFVKANLGGFVALVFLILPVWLLERRNEPLKRYGLPLLERVRYGPILRDPIDWQQLGRGLAWGVGTTVLVLGAFMVAYVLYFDAVCGSSSELLGPLGRRCSRYVGGLGNLALRTPPDIWMQVVGQIVVVAIPEEVFYRGYLLGRLEQAMPSKRTLLGAPIGWALVLHAALFGLGHFLVDLNPLRLAVAIPALLFGFLRGASRSILAPVIFHASANLLMLVVDRSFFPG